MQGLFRSIESYMPGTGIYLDAVSGGGRRPLVSCTASLKG